MNPAGIVIGVMAVGFAFIAGREIGWEQHYRREVVCQTTIDGNVLCVPADKATKDALGGGE